MCTVKYWAVLQIVQKCFKEIIMHPPMFIVWISFADNKMKK